MLLLVGELTFAERVKINIAVNPVTLPVYCTILDKWTKCLQAGLFFSANVCIWKEFRRSNIFLYCIIFGVLLWSFLLRSWNFKVYRNSTSRKQGISACLGSWEGIHNYGKVITEDTCRCDCKSRWEKALSWRKSVTVTEVCFRSIQ